LEWDFGVDGLADEGFGVAGFGGLALPVALTGFGFAPFLLLLAAVTISSPSPGAPLASSSASSSFFLSFAFSCSCDFADPFPLALLFPLAGDWSLEGLERVFGFGEGSAGLIITKIF
jgi:hypothetical protein